MHQDKLIIFDCDGTLTDSRAAIVAAMQEAFMTAGMTAPDAKDIRQVVGLSLLAALSQLAPNIEQEALFRLADHYEAISLKQAQHAPNIVPLFAGCHQALLDLHAQGYQLAIATGMGRRGLEELLKSHGLDDLFTILKTANDGPSKPDPKILLDALLETGVDPENAVMIGDTIFDINAAKKAEIHAIGVDWGNHEVAQLLDCGADKIVASFEELTTYIQHYFR